MIPNAAYLINLIGFPWLGACSITGFHPALVVRKTSPVSGNQGLSHGARNSGSAYFGGSNWGTATIESMVAGFNSTGSKPGVQVFEGL
jgi:hypothetical protein